MFLLIGLHKIPERSGTLASRLFAVCGRSAFLARGGSGGGIFSGSFLFRSRITRSVSVLLRSILRGSVRSCRSVFFFFFFCTHEILENYFAKFFSTGFIIARTSAMM